MGRVKLPPCELNKGCSLWCTVWLLQRSQFWLHVGNCFFDLHFVAFVITIIHNSLPQQTLTLFICSAHRWPNLAQLLMLFLDHPVMSDSLWLCGLQHSRSPCPSSSPRVCPSSCSLHWRCHPAISSSDTIFSLCRQSFPASGTLPVSHLFTSGNQNTGASALALVLPMSIQGWFPLGLTGLISLLSKKLSGVFSSTTV